MAEVVWVFSAILALVFLIVGVLMLFSYEQARKRLPWVNDIPRALVALIGAVEVLAALGLILPAATGFLPWLTPVAAVALALLMLGAIVFRALRREREDAALCVLLLLLAAFVAYMRWGLLLLT